MSITKNDIVKYLLETLFLFNLFFALFPAWRLSPLWEFIPYDGYFDFWMALLDKINVAICFAIILVDHKFKSRILFFAIMLLFLSVALSMFINNMHTGLITLICFPIEYLVIFIVARKYTFSKNIIRITILSLSIWSILPLFVMMFGMAKYKLAMITSVDGQISTFGGFAFHRNFYGFYAGITILLCLFQRIKNVIKLSIITLCLVGILISASRSALISSIISMMFYFFLTNRKKFMIMLPVLTSVMIVIISAYAYFNIRSKGLEDNDDRYELLEGFAKIISENPVWGQGQAVLYYSGHYPDGSPAHNFIAQVWADYGIVTLFSLLCLLFLIFIKSKIYLKIFLVYLLLFGMSQPYFYLSMPQAFMMISFLMGNCIYFNNKSKNRERYCNH